MSERTERFLIVYFRALALSCSAPKRAVQLLLTVYLALVLGDMAVQLWRYCDAAWLSDNIQLHYRQQLRLYMRSINIMKVAYLMMHLLIVAQALLWRNWERRLLSLLPQSLPAGSQINVRFHLTLEGVISSCVLLVSISSLPQLQHMISNLRYLFNTQAVRARYLQMALFVLRLDAQLQQLQLELEQAGAEGGGGRGSQVELRSRYAHLVRLSAHISRFFGFSILLMNLLCIGDFILVCYSYIVLWQFSDTTLSWMLLCQTVYVLIPALVKIWTLCAACHKCANRVGSSSCLSLSLYFSHVLSSFSHINCSCCSTLPASSNDLDAERAPLSIWLPHVMELTSSSCR